MISGLYCWESEEAWGIHNIQLLYHERAGDNVQTADRNQTDLNGKWEKIINSIFTMPAKESNLVRGYRNGFIILPNFPVSFENIF